MASARTAIIIGAGPGGLTAAHELLRRTDVTPIVLEATDQIGGISRTVNHDGNRMDIGGHRFFSKSDRVMRWWLDVLPLQRLTGDIDVRGLLGGAKGDGGGPDPEVEDDVMLVRSRTSHILHDGKLFDYPLTLSTTTLRKLGLLNTLRYGLSYVQSMVDPVRPENSLEDFLINRFGRALYQRFFEEYTRKVCGVPCREIPAEWGAQRIKGLSIHKALLHAARNMIAGRGDIAQKGTETSLIKRFLYPKYGPGHLWQVVARRVEAAGGSIRFHSRVTALRHEEGRIRAVTVEDGKTGAREEIEADVVISTMPVRNLVAGLNPVPPAPVREVADGLQYRDFMTAGLLIDRIELGGGATAAELEAKVPDNWIYIQEPGVQVGRMQIFNNWSPYMVADRSRILIGLEYFCRVGDPLWRLEDERFLDLGVKEVDRLGLVHRKHVAARMIARMPKAYPAYFGSYDRFATVQEYLDGFGNLFLVGRNGMHRYNNQDHSMLTAILAVESIAEGRTDKAAIWSVNTETDYHEERSSSGERGADAQAVGKPQMASSGE